MNERGESRGEMEWADEGEKSVHKGTKGIVFILADRD